MNTFQLIVHNQGDVLVTIDCAVLPHPAQYGPPEREAYVDEHYHRAVVKMLNKEFDQPPLYVTVEDMEVRSTREKQPRSSSQNFEELLLARAESLGNAAAGGDPTAATDHEELETETN